MKKLSYLLLLIVLLLIFNPIFSFKGVTAGDWPFFFPEQLQVLPIVPPLWNSHFDLGRSTISPWIDGYLGISVGIFVRGLGLPWNVVQVLSFFLPALLFSAITPILLYKALTKRVLVIPGLVFTLNSYFLMIYAGGQMGIVLAYSVTPLVFLTFIKLQERLVPKTLPFVRTVLFSLSIALQFLFDFRIGYVTLIGCGLYWLFMLFMNGSFRKSGLLIHSFLFSFFFPALLVFLLHAYWLLPNILFKVNPAEQLGIGYSSLESVRFFSFARLENTMALLHPNWPENLFGKVAFMRPEFLIIPILAFLSLLFVQKRKGEQVQRSADITVLFFVFLGLVGIFLAKGTNAPLGLLYVFLYESVPGFFMFRDPTKFYVLIALSYAVLITFSVESMQDLLVKKRSVFLGGIFFASLFVFWLFPIRQAILGELTGVFRQKDVPSDYHFLKDVLVQDTNFSRTLWIPARQRFGYYSSKHPAIDAQNFFQVASPAGVVAYLKNPQAQQLLAESAVRYIVVPDDSQGELFLKDRVYDEKQYKETIRDIEKISWLTRERHFTMSKIAVFTIETQKSRFWSTNGTPLSWKELGMNRYEVIPQRDTIDRLILSERYDANWVARTKSREYPAEKYHNNFVSFRLSTIEESVEVLYKPEEWRDRGTVISGITLIGLLLYLVAKRKKLYA